MYAAVTLKLIYSLWCTVFNSGNVLLRGLVNSDLYVQSGMTNYRIDRIGTHRHASADIDIRHASAPNLTTSTRQNRCRGKKKYSFRVLILGRLLAK